MTSKTLLVGFSYKEKLPSKIIRFLTRSHVSHSFCIATVSSVNMDMVFHADGVKVTYTTFDSFVKHNKITDIFEIEMDEQQYNDSIRFRLNACGKDYSQKLILGFGWVLLARMFGFKVKNPFSDSHKSYICTELISDMLHLPIESETLTPDDLLEVMELKYGDCKIPFPYKQQT